MKCLIAIVGPTAVGKSSLSLAIAREFNCEIINGDSRQIYRFMDIGTSKPNKRDFEAIPHHLFDIVNPDEPYSVALYRNAALNIIGGIQQRENLPLLVGGSGLYVWSLLESWDVPRVPPDTVFRKKLEAEAHEKGTAFVYRMLEEVDPEAAAKILQGNLRRIIRALEISHVTGRQPSTLQKKGLPICPVLVIGLTAEREALYRMIDNRVDDMIEQGLIDEVKMLESRGYQRDLPSMSSIGYKQIYAWLAGEIGLEEAVRQIKTKTHAFARRQYAWFRLNDSRIHWFTAGETNYRGIIALLYEFVEKAKRNEIGNEFY
ncbi:MAG TPA: tRNA (adenosine(37)-N6)-dimethylallyltransferase MiaA [Dehalococcoidia bacterium]|nr:tRNA (adenosine(37)-N6)-dimethylallyltransferase MiaA [Dehalococcoidia bacterium]